MPISNRIDHNSWLNLFRNPKQRRFWLFSGVATFLHAIVDPILTYIIVVVFGVGYESNPMLAAPLNQSLTAFILVHVPLWVIITVVIVMFAIIFEKAPLEDIDTIVYYGEFVWLGIILWGILLVGNNLFVLVSAMSDSGL